LVSSRRTRWTYPEGMKGLSPGFQPRVTIDKTIRPHKEHGGVTGELVSMGICVFMWQLGLVDSPSGER